MKTKAEIVDTKLTAGVPVQDTSDIYSTAHYHSRGCTTQDVCTNLENAPLKGDRWKNQRGGGVRLKSGKKQ